MYDAWHATVIAAAKPGPSQSENAFSEALSGKQTVASGGEIAGGGGEGTDAVDFGNAEFAARFGTGPGDGVPFVAFGIADGTRG